MSNEPTPWEDINPPMASVPRQEPGSLCSVTEDRKTFRNELTACLALTAPAGMTEEARRDWLAVAWDTLKHIPADILTIGARKARQQCDHPSKIVPTIISETADMVRWRSEAKREEPVALIERDYCTPEEAKRILNEFGIKRDWAA